MNGKLYRQHADVAPYTLFLEMKTTGLAFLGVLGSAARVCGTLGKRAPTRHAPHVSQALTY